VAEAIIWVAERYRTELVNNQTSKERTNLRRMMTPEQRVEHDLRPVIYVGGDVLSRGITLEGLKVSYFVRQPGSADTLLQMGRWFGYRDGYDDLIRMPANVEEIFGNVARISQELREDLREMQAHGLTPEQFGIKIRLIPEIAIVSANKRRAAKVEEVTVNLHGQIKQSVNLALEHKSRNAEAIGELLARVASMGVRFEPNGQPHGWHSVPLELISEFFDQFTGHQSDLFFGTGPGLAKPQIKRFLSESKNAQKWDVVIVNGAGGNVTVELPAVPGASPIEFKSSVRNTLQVDKPVVGSLHFKNQQVASPTDLANALSREEYRFLRDEEKESLSLDERIAKRYVTHPMLMLYAVTTREEEGKPSPEIQIGAEDPLWAVRVVFPPLRLDSAADLELQGRGVKILVNTVWQEQFFGIDADAEEFDEEADG
ncbi:MAG TPA: Z1 domain-containing protein, partial [Terrimesophilobacter sp.]|nr:Z1 domain-containing protein [Terrimesophilobacter sp.]